MKIIAIRHGEQLYPYDAQGRKLVSGLNAPLIELGRVQMQELGKKLAGERQTLNALYTSPVLRSQQSTAVLAEVRSVSQIRIVDGLKEVFPNSAEGKPYADVEKIGGDIYAHPFSKNQESLIDLVERERAAIRFILSDARERGYQCVGIISHGDPLCALDWSLKYSTFPSSYAEMRDAFYLQKGQAVEYIIGQNLRLESEGRIITTESVNRTVEGFRNHSQKEVK